ncbi:hypothetical protein [Cellvibrio mixtus]|uniref:hypothetical protein n=1 Tax=Cellvibrio mixtus TaxID=39650 RepID=UPI000587D509|nr:hypothetical protein [Cellvibrio mixtus]
MKSMKHLIFLLLLAFSLIVLVLTLNAANDAWSSSSLGFTAWGLVPWLYVAMITSFIAQKSKLIAIAITAAIVGLLGIGVMIDTLFIHLDAQGALAFIFIPFWQLVFFIFASPLLLLFKKAHS